MLAFGQASIPSWGAGAPGTYVPTRERGNDQNKIVSAVVIAGAGREAAKLRSYLSAAFSAELRAESDPEIPPGLHGFNLAANTAAGLASLSKFNKARETTLSKEEFRIYWQKIKALPGVTGTALRLCVLLGGQRIFQLLRLQKNDINIEENQIILYDTKGKRTDPRRHVLPLTEHAKAELMPFLAIHDPYVLTSTNGRISLDPGTISNAVAKISKEMVAAGVRSEPFQLRDIRRTIETLLVGQGVSMEIRAQLQSHGLSGVQNRHYDKHKYMDEKLAAMDKIYRLLTDKPAKIIKLRKAAG